MSSPVSRVGSDPLEPPDSPPGGFIAIHSPVDTPTDRSIDSSFDVAHIAEENSHDVDQVEDTVSDILDDDDSDAGATGVVVSVVKAQDPFQPGSTPVENTKRYLAYNLVGVIEVTDLRTHHVVNVEFHDKSKRRAYHFTDPFRYNLAALGHRGAIYACQPDTSYPAHIVYKPYGSWASHSEWKYDIRGGTSIVGVAAGGSSAAGTLREGVDIENLGNVVIATSDDELIFLSGGGIERTFMTLPGTFITMVAGGEWLFLVTRDGSTTTDGSQNLMGRLIKFDDFCILQKENIPVPKHHTLKWVGITDEGAPAIYDSSGALSIMPRFRIPLSVMWMRILHTGKMEQGTGSCRSYWPVGVIGNTFFCLVLRGQQTHPGFPRPVLHEITICLPYKRIDSEEVHLEQRVIHETVLLNILRDAIGHKQSTQELAERELALDKIIIQLVGHACQTNRQGRALDFARLLHVLPSFDAAIELANSYGLTDLQKAIERLKVGRGGSVWRGCSASQRPMKLTTTNRTAPVGQTSQK